MTVKELIIELAQFPGDMEVVDCDYDAIGRVRQGTLTHDNYPYNKPDRTVVVIE